MGALPPDSRLSAALNKVQVDVENTIKVGDLVHRRFEARLNILHLLGMDKITPKEYRSLYSMINSVDDENLLVAEELIKEKCK